MKTKFLVVLLILSGLLVSADKTYACNDPPNADLDASPNPVCVGCSVTLDGSGSCDPDGEITKYEWDWTNDGEYDYEETPGDGIATHIYTIAGTYTAKLRVTDDDDATDTDTCQVTVVKVLKVVKAGTADEGPLYVCLNSSVDLEAKPYPAGASFPSGEPHWTIESQPSGANATLNPSSGSAATTVDNLTKAGHYIVKAKCGSSDSGDTITVTAFKIKSQTVSPIPANRDRTILGIAERVTCSTEPSVSVDWRVNGGGTVTPASGTSTTFTASKSPSNPIVHAEVGTTDCILVFTVIAPTGMTVSLKVDDPDPSWTPDSNQIGARSIFNCTVTQTTVSFKWGEFQENIPLNEWTWPDETEQSNPAHTVPWGVDYDNTTTDTLSPHGGLQPIGRIHDGSSYVDFSYIINVPEEYNNENNQWILWLPYETHPREFRGSDQQARVILNATNSANGGWMGPWE